jgi:RsiW-degrading membrane proteinase PrsW (M82 family)
MGLIFGLTLAVALPLFFLAIIRWSDFYQTGQPKFILLSLAWGVIAWFLGSLSNNLLLQSGLADQETIIHTCSPIHEEIFKGLIFLYLMRRSHFTYSVDGAVYGFAAGTGFAVIENFEYIFYSATAMIDAWQRVLSADLVHATCSAVIGIALGIFNLKQARWRWLVFTMGLFLAISLHTIYNWISHDKISLYYAIGTGVLGFAFIYFAMQLGKKQAQGWIRQKLGMLDGVTNGEVALVNRLDSNQDIFFPIFERFGVEKARQVEKLTYLQARLGIKRKALDSFQNSSMRKALEAEIRGMQKEVRTEQRAIGTYAMLFVRGLFSEEMVSVWERMQAKIRERSAEKNIQKGPNVWSSLDERVKAPTDVERRE